MKIDNKILTLVNIYAPNNHNPTSFQNLLDHLLSFELKKLLWAATLIWSRTFRGTNKE